MTEWMTAADLKGLPGMPGTVQGVAKMARREAWDSRRRKGRGGGREFAITALPEVTQAALRLTATAANDQPTRTEAEAAQLWDNHARKPAGVRAEASRRMQILMALVRLQDDGTRRGAALDAVADQAGVSKPTIRRWEKLVAGLPRDVWLPHLAPDWKPKQAARKTDPEAWDHLLADYLRAERPSFKACYDRVAALAADRGWTLEHVRTLQRRMDRDVDPITRRYLRHGPESVKRMIAPVERTRDTLMAMEAVVGDGHKFDVFVRWPDGHVGRPVMLAWQDFYSGKILGWRIDRTESADLVRLAFADVVADFGIPARVVVDNGRGFASKWMSGRMPTRFRFKIKADEPAGIWAHLGCDVIWTTPYSGQSKPIERAFRDLAETISKHPACAGAWTGNRPDNKPHNHGSAAVPLAEFAALCQREIAAHNARPGRRGGVCHGRSFDAVFQESYSRVPVRKASADDRALLLLAAENVSCRQPDGAIHLHGGRYWAEALTAHIGRKVTVRFDPQNGQAPVRAYTTTGALIGEIPLAHRFEALDPEGAKAISRDRKRITKKAKELADLERKYSAKQLAAAYANLPDAETAPPDAKVIKAVFRPVEDPPDADSPPPGSPTPEDIREERFAAGVARLKAAAKRERGY